MKLFANFYVTYGLVFVAFVILATKVFYPNHRIIALVIYLVSLASFFLTVKSSNNFLASQSFLKTILVSYWVYLLLALVFFVFIYVLYVLFPINSALKDIPDEQLQAHIEGDREALIYIDKEMSELVTDMSSLKIFDMSPEQIIANSDQIKTLWSEFVENTIELDLIKTKYKGFNHINFVTKPALHSQSFMLAYASFISQYSRSLEFVNFADSNVTLITLLNEPSVSPSIPEFSYEKIKSQLTSTDEIIRLNAGRLYLPAAKTMYKNDVTLLSMIDSAILVVDSTISAYPGLLVKKPLNFLEKNAFRAWFPIQKNIAENISYIRLTNRDYLIAPEIIQSYKDTFEPGDIFLERREWHATNAGIPGYWTHAAMYLGTLDELSDYFEGIDELNGQTFSDYVSVKHPDFVLKMSELDESGFEKRLIESKRDGVILTSLEYSAGGDALGVLRARNLTKSQKFSVVLNAIQHMGKPYDYNFDFTTDSALVCSELIYKAYVGVGDLQLKLQNLNGRVIYSPNDFAMKFDNEFNTDESKLKFVLFLDGNEKTGEVVSRTADEFRTSWQRPKWHIVKSYL